MKTNSQELAKYIISCYPKQAQAYQTDKNVIKFLADRVVIYSKGKINLKTAYRVIEVELGIIK
jgi:hypothetical protein